MGSSRSSSEELYTLEEHESRKCVFYLSQQSRIVVFLHLFLQSSWRPEIWVETDIWTKDLCVCVFDNSLQTWHVCLSRGKKVCLSWPPCWSSTCIRTYLSCTRTYSHCRLPAEIPLASSQRWAQCFSTTQTWWVFQIAPNGHELKL